MNEEERNKILDALCYNIAENTLNEYKQKVKEEWKLFCEQYGISDYKEKLFLERLGIE
jgi:hypothetical protein